MTVILLPIFLAVILFLLLVWHLFFRYYFSAPEDFPELKIQTIEDTKFLVENDLPYPSGIRSSSLIKISLNGTWRFRLDSENKFNEVEVPFCFNTADSPLRDHQGIVWYERTFTLPEWQVGERLRLAFMGSFYRTKVWLDGDLVGSNAGGYLPFYFDITDRVQPNTPHTLKVSVDSRIDSTSLPPHLFQGHNVGWHLFGGLHRELFIEILLPVSCFKLQVDSDSERVYCTALFHKPDRHAAPLQTAELKLLTAGGQPLAEVQVSVIWDGAYGAATHTFTIDEPVRWSPQTPHLYTCEVRTGYESVETAFGFRDVKAQDGKILLDEQPIFLKGICRHQEDRPDGLAQGAASVKVELEAIQHLNGNFVRLTHYPHSSETLDMCDEMGLAAWVEIPLYQAGLGIIRYLFDKTKKDTGKTFAGLLKIFWDTNALGNKALMRNARNQMLKMIERDRNHPSVLIWGLGNECWSFNPAGAKALAWLRNQAETLDTSRLFSYAAFAMQGLGPIFERSFDVTDVIGVNEYFGWYYGETQDAGGYLQAVARRYPQKPLLVTETGTDTVRGRQGTGRYSEAFQVAYLEEQWRQMTSVPTFAGLSIWVLKDFLCPEYREDNPVPFYNLKGLLDCDGRPKAAFDTVKKFYGEENYR